MAERKYDPGQYERLIHCSKGGVKGIQEWNKWRAENPKDEVHLEKGALGRLHLEEVDFSLAHLEGADLTGTYLEGANLNRAHIEGAQFDNTWLQGTNFLRAIGDSETLVWGCKVNRYSEKKEYTDFSGVSLNNIRIDPGTRQLLEYNIRRQNWVRWYKDNPVLQLLVRWFWRMSDYGYSTARIMRSFFLLSFAFATIYYVWGVVDYYFVGVKDCPGIVSNLFVLEDTLDKPETYKFIGEDLLQQQRVSLMPVSGVLVPVRALYFSIVTMTTLGFGDLYANPHSVLRGVFGHVLLGLQVILGYVLLGALVTRFAVIFTSMGPARKFASREKGGAD